MGMVHQLLFIKDFHQKKAEMALQTARMSLQAAKHQEEQANNTLATFQEHAKREELSWFEDLCSRLVKVRDIQMVQADVAQLRATENMHLQNLQQAQQHHMQASDTHQEANHAKKEADKVREKFTELVRLQDLTDANEVERKEELELEELSGNLRPQPEADTV